VHIHIQPWEELKPEAAEVMRRGKEKHFDYLLEVMRNPRLLIELMDEQQIWRVGLVNYPSPDLMGFTEKTNEFAAQYAAADTSRLLPYGGVHPLFSRNPVRDVEHLLELGTRVLKIHPPHQKIAANAYTNGLESLALIYGTCEKHGLPVMVHTGTSIFPGARSKYGNPMELDDVAIDFPSLQILMAHGGRPLYMEEAFFVLRRHKNVWLDLSGIPPLKMLEYFPRLEELRDRVLWGTDWPSPGVSSMQGNVQQFLSTSCSTAFKRDVLQNNAERILPVR
jgi:predicted TIM-barrel fold metal-dependent hydrolase